MLRIEEVEPYEHHHVIGCLRSTAAETLKTRNLLSKAGFIVAFAIGSFGVMENRRFFVAPSRTPRLRISLQRKQLSVLDPIKILLPLLNESVNPLQNRIHGNAERLIKRIALHGILLKPRLHPGKSQLQNDAPVGN